jgi:hypothetical protein
MEIIPPLMKLCEKKARVILDIKRAFLQVSVNKHDQDFLGFL